MCVLFHTHSVNRRTNFPRLGDWRWPRLPISLHRLVTPDERGQTRMMVHIGGEPIVDLVGISILAVTGLAGTLWMGLRHQAAVGRYHRLRREAASIRESRQRLVHFASDLAATLNLSLAWCVDLCDEPRRTQMENLREAFREAMQRHVVDPPSPWDVGIEAPFCTIRQEGVTGG